MSDLPAKREDLSLDQRIDAAEERYTSLEARIEAEFSELAADGVVSLQEAPEEARRQIARKMASVQRMKADLEEAASEKKALLKQKQRELEERMRQMSAMFEPLQAMMRQLEEGIWMVNLYLGTEEKIVQLIDGEPAAADAPIHVRQLVLAMDQECAVAAEEGGIDAVNYTEFDEWLKADPAHVQQVIPEERCVVACQPRFDPKEYEDPWKMAQVAEANEQTYFLIRNGERIYRIWTNFKVGGRLIPRRDEFTDLFWEEQYDFDSDEKRRVAMEPGSRSWEQAEERAEARQRHYMRVGLILQGLIDRTTVWQPLPPEGISFLDESSHEEGRVRFILDGDDDRLVGTGREGFRSWQKRLNQSLQVGMRVVLDEFGAYNEGWYLDGGRGRYNPRLHPQGAEMPPSGELLQIEEKDKGEFIVRYQRTEEVYDPKMWVTTRPGWGYRGGYRLPKMRASFRLQPEDRFLIPYDLVTEEECREYLTARLERRHYVSMFPVLKGVLRAKRAEREAEAPFVRMLAGVLARENGGSVEEAEARLPDLVRWFKLGNRYHRPLLTEEPETERVVEKEGREGRSGRVKWTTVQVDPDVLERRRKERAEDNARAVRLIVEEDRRRRKDRKPLNEDLLDHVRRSFGAALLAIFRKRDGWYQALVRANQEDVYVHRYEWSPTGRAGTTKEWWLPEPSVISRWKLIEDGETWRGWKIGVPRSEHLTGPELDEVKALLRPQFEERHLGDPDNRGKRALRGSQEATEVVAISWEPDDDPMVWAAMNDDRYAVMGCRMRWKKEKGEVKVWAEWSINSIPRWDGDHLKIRDKCFFYDEEAVERARVERDRREEEDRRQRAKTDRAHGRIGELERAYQEREEAKAYAAFMQEYGEPDLWEGHLKGLDIPHWRSHDQHSRGSALREFLYEHVDSIDFRGRTLGEVWPAAPEDIADLRFPKGDETATCSVCEEEKPVSEVFMPEEDGEEPICHDCQIGDDDDVD